MESYTTWIGDKPDFQRFENVARSALDALPFDPKEILYFPSVPYMPPDEKYDELVARIVSEISNLNQDDHNFRIPVVAAWVRNNLHPQDVRLSAEHTDVAKQVVTEGVGMPVFVEDQQPGGVIWNCFQREIMMRMKLTELFLGDELLLESVGEDREARAQARAKAFVDDFLRRPGNLSVYTVNAPDIETVSQWMTEHRTPMKAVRMR